MFCLELLLVSFWANRLKEAFESILLKVSLLNAKRWMQKM